MVFESKKRTVENLMETEGGKKSTHGFKALLECGERVFSMIKKCTERTGMNAQQELVP